MSVIGRIWSRRRSPPQPRFTTDGRISLVAGVAAGVPVVAVAGEVDIATAPKLRDGLREQPAGQPLLLDLAGVTFMDSSGLAALLDVQREVAARGGRLAVLAPSQPVALLFDVAGVGAQLPVFASVEEALAA